ncbi:hypothetical protein N9C22_03775 [Paracoccaceae bacterium]|nr:hypothetical protein [Paracoccaceae bacterium]
MKDKMRSFSKFRFKPEAVAHIGLPNIEFPIPTEKLPSLVSAGGNISRDLLVYWMMDYLSLNNEEREYYEVQLLKCAEVHAVSTGQSEYWHYCEGFHKVAPDDDVGLTKRWSIFLGNVDRTQHVVSIQNWNFPGVISSAFCRGQENHDLVVSCFTAPSLDGINFIKEYGKSNLSTERPFNSFDLLVQSTKGMGTIMSANKGNDYPVNWEYGVGWKSETVFDEAYQFAQQPNPIPADWVKYFLDVVERFENDTVLCKLT